MPWGLHLSRLCPEIRIDGTVSDKLGTSTEIAGKDRVAHYAQRRKELAQLYNGLEIDPEFIPPTSASPIVPIIPQPLRPATIRPPADSSRTDRSRTATQRQQKLSVLTRTAHFPSGLPLEMALLPAGEFTMGDARRARDDQRPHLVTIDKPFWIGRFEITNQQFADFDPEHDSRVESRFGMQFGVRGFYVNGPQQPVVRISWDQAMAFCDWLSQQTSHEFTLPTEGQWEYACRAGTDTPFNYGDDDTDFSRHANLADTTLSEFVCHPYKKTREPLPNRSKYDDWIPKDERFNDGGFLSDGVGRYRPNAWQLHDMHGNVSEWTRSAPWPYPYRHDDGRNDTGLAIEKRIVRGGSWRDRPARAQSGFRLSYRHYQPVYHVGFRVVCTARDLDESVAANNSTGPGHNPL